MSNMINIRRDVKDTYYRYKMPRLVSKIEGKGNGIKTVVSNMVDIAKSLNRPPVYVTKFFGNEVGSLTVCDEKAARYIVNGAHEAEKLQSLLDVFIAKFVLCQSCENPETDLSVGRDGTVYRSCKACGHRGTVDMAHKLCTFIQKNPPARPKKIGNANKGATSSGDAGFNEEDGSGEQGEEEEEGMTAPEGIESGFIRTTNGFNDADDDWAATSGDARDAELEGLSSRVRKSLAIRDGDDDSSGPLEAFGEFLDANGAISNDDLLREVGDRALRPDKAIVVIVQALFQPDRLMAVFAARQPVLLALLEEAGGKGPRALLGSFERVVGVHHPEILSATPALLQHAYQHDLLSETDILAWNAHISKRYVSKDVALRVRKAAEPFVNWLQNAESEDEDEDGSGDEDEE